MLGNALKGCIAEVHVAVTATFQAPVRWPRPATRGRGGQFLFSGSPESDIGRWVRDMDVGQIVTSYNLEDASGWTASPAMQPEMLERVATRCKEVYLAFRGQTVKEAWDLDLRGLLASSHLGAC